MPVGIGQPFLNDTEGRQTDGIPDSRKVSIDREIDVEAAGAELLDERREPIERGKRVGDRKRVAGLAHRVQDAGEIVENVLRPSANVAKRFAGAVRIRPEQMLRDSGLHIYDGDVMRHNIVQLTGETVALFNGR